PSLHIRLGIVRLKVCRVGEDFIEDKTTTYLAIFLQKIREGLWVIADEIDKRQGRGAQFGLLSRFRADLCDNREGAIWNSTVPDARSVLTTRLRDHHQDSQQC